MHAQPLANSDKERITGVLQSLGQILCAVTGVVMAVHFVIFYLNGAGTGVAGVQIHYLFLQRSAGNKGFEHGAGHIGVRHGKIAPLILYGSALCLTLFGLILNFLNGFFVLIVSEFVRLIAVIIRHRTHCQHCAAVAVHHHTVGALAPVLLHGLPQPLFQVILNGLVKGQYQRVAVLRSNRGGIIVGNTIGFGVLSRDQPSRRAGEQIIVVLLQTGQALIVCAGKADHAGGQRAVRIISLGGLLHPNAVGHCLLVNKIRQLLFNIILHLLPHNHIVIFLSGFFFQRLGFFFVQIKELGQLRDQYRTLFVLNVQRIQIHGPYRSGLGQNITVAVINGTAHGRYLRIRQLLALRLGGVFVAL